MEIIGAKKIIKEVIYNYKQNNDWDIRDITPRLFYRNNKIVIGVEFSGVKNKKDTFKKVQKELWAIHDQTTPRQQHFKVYQLNKNERIKKVVLSLNNVCEVIVLNTKFYLW